MSIAGHQWTSFAIVVAVFLCTLSLHIPNALASLTCYAPNNLESISNPQLQLLLTRLNNFNIFLGTVFTSSAGLDAQLAIVSTVLDPNAYVYLPDTGTYGGPNGLGLEGIIEYAWIFNPFKNQLWVAPQTLNSSVCIDPTLPNQILLYFFGAFHFSPTLPNPFATGTILVEQFNYTLYFNGSRPTVSWIRLDIDRQSAIRTGEAHQSIFDVCLLINSTCNGTNQVYATIWDCIDFMSTLPLFQCQNELFQGNSFACRNLHHYLAVFRPDIHCVHTAPVSPVCYKAQCKGVFFKTQNGKQNHH